MKFRHWYRPYLIKTCFDLFVDLILLQKAEWQNKVLDGEAASVEPP